MRVRLEVRLAKRVGRRGDDIECRVWKGARRQIRSASQTVKRCGEEFIELDDVRQRQYVEDPEAPAQSCELWSWKTADHPSGAWHPSVAGEPSVFRELLSVRSPFHTAGPD